MKNYKELLPVLLGIFVATGGISHFMEPEFYVKFIPDFLPLQIQDMIIFFSGGAEIFLGAAILIPKLRYYASRGIFLLMLSFLPVHVSDMFMQAPAIGSHEAAVMRIPAQFLFIIWAWLAVKDY